MTDDEGMNSFFEFYETLDQDFWWVESRNDLISKMIDRYAGPNRRLRILDLGCGTGLNYRSLQEHGEVYSLDRSDKALKYCRQKGIGSLVLGDAEKLPFSSSQFDLVVAIELIEHIERDQVVVSEINRILKDDGLAVITTPAFDFLWSSDDVVSGHKRRYTQKRLRRLLEDNGFKILLSSYRYFFIFAPTFILFRLQSILRVKRNSLSYTPGLIGWLLKRINAVENYLISKGLRFPLGVGLICVIKK